MLIIMINVFVVVLNWWLKDKLSEYPVNLVSILSTFYVLFFSQYPFAKKLLSRTVTNEKWSTFIWKIRALNVDEIDSWGTKPVAMCSDKNQRFLFLFFEKSVFFQPFYKNLLILDLFSPTFLR